MPDERREIRIKRPASHTALGELFIARKWGEGKRGVYKVGAGDRHQDYDCRAFARNPAVFATCSSVCHDVENSGRLAMSEQKPPWSVDIPLTIKPLRGFDYKLVEPKLDGLLLNVDRDLQRKTNEFAAAQHWHATRQVIAIMSAVRFVKNSYNAVRYLTADTPEDNARKPNYV